VIGALIATITDMMALAARSREEGEAEGFSTQDAECGWFSTCVKAAARGSPRARAAISGQVDRRGHVRRSPASMFAV
jgi:hypothetical protein